MKVYRLERNGYGVFCESDSKIQLPFSEDSLYQSHGYSCDTQYRVKDEYRSACESIEKLVEYFGSDFAYALDKGASIVEYTVHKAHVRFGLRLNIEVVFNSEKVKDKTVILQGKDEWHGRNS